MEIWRENGPSVIFSYFVVTYKYMSSVVIPTNVFIVVIITLPPLPPLTLVPIPSMLINSKPYISSILSFLRNHPTTTRPLRSIVTESNIFPRDKFKLLKFMDVTPDAMY